MFKLYKDKETDDSFKLEISGIKVDSYASDHEGMGILANIHETDAYKLILECTIAEILESFIELSFYTPLIEDFHFKIYLINWPINHERTKCVWVNIGFCESVEDWSRPYSMNKYLTALQEASETYNKTEVMVFEGDGPNDDYILNGIGFNFTLPEPGKTISEVIKQTNEIFNYLHPKAEELIRKTTGKITLEFNFPAEISTPCQQYLIYFSQFMADLGIEVINGIEHSQTKTLFTVEPVNKNHALSTIQDALAAYLSLPTQYEAPLGNTDVAVMQLEANIYHLKSQLLLAQSLIETKNAQINYLQLSQETYEELQKKNITDEPETESIIGEIVKVKKYDGKLFSVDMPRLFRNLKRIVKGY